MTRTFKKTKTLLCIVCFFFSLPFVNAQSITDYIKLINKKFNAKEASIRIDNKLADYDALLAIQDSTLLKMELYDRKTAIAMYGKEESRNGVLSVTLRKHKENLRNPNYSYNNNGDSTLCEQHTPATIDGDTTNKNWQDFLVKNLKGDVPVEAGSPPGIYIVYVIFIVDANGTITDVRIPEDPGYGTGKEVKRLMKTSPKWQPGTCNGNIVRFKAIQRVTFMVSAG